MFVFIPLVERLVLMTKYIDDLLNKQEVLNVLNSLSIGIMFVDKHNRISIINTAAEGIRNIKSDERIGTSVLDCHSAKVHKRVELVIKELAEDRHNSRHKVIKVKGKYFDNQYNTVFDENGEYQGIVLVSQDVTEKVELENQLKRTNEKLENMVEKRTAEIKKAYKELKVAKDHLMQSEKMSAVGQFVAGLAHEINNPLDGIQNCIRTVMNTMNEQNENKKYLELGMEGLFKIEILVRQLLDYARPHSAEKTILNVSDLIEDALNLTRFRLKEKDIFIEKENNCTTGSIYGDSHYLEQVFVNLILNASDAMEQNGVLKIACEEDDENVTLKIRDNGCGITNENLSKIFNPFYTTKEKNKGTGLGLYLSYNVIKEHDGTIDVWSNPEEGTTFTIAFPKEIPEEYVTEEYVQEKVSSLQIID